MNDRIGFFEEKDGKLSYQRLQSIILLCLFCIVTGFEVYKNQIDFEVLALLAVAAIAPKLLQKVVENKGVKK